MKEHGGERPGAGRAGAPLVDSGHYVLQIHRVKHFPTHEWLEDKGIMEYAFVAGVNLADVAQRLANQLDAAVVTESAAYLPVATRSDVAPSNKERPHGGR